jgi:hypothetical protein
MFTTIINDCKDDNARGRQESRIASLIETGLSFIGVESDLEASMQLIDVLDATEGRKGLVLVNVAPRGGHTTKWENGTPFGFFWYKETLVVASVDGYVLSAVKKLGLLKSFSLLDTHTSADAMLKAGFIDEIAANQIPTTQFRSFDFIPRAGVFMALGNELPYTDYSLDNIPDLPKAIWHIDNFGNCKTTLMTEDINQSGTTETHFGTLPYFEQLRNVPDGATGLVHGSSGINDTRFIELMAQRTSFARNHGVKIGDDIFSAQSYFRKATS